MDSNTTRRATGSVLFTGQGSQVKGMGAELFDRFPELTGRANDVLGYDLPRLCLEDPEDRLDDTRYTQPALYVVNALSYFDSLEEGQPEGDFLLGHSLGEYNALHAAGAFDFETGLKLVIKRGELMARSRAGGMLAVVGMAEEELRDFLAQHALQLDVANLNTPTQVVLSGLDDDIARAHQLLETQRVRVARLRVSAAFHSRHMRPASDEFGAFLKGFRFAPLRKTVIANVTARPYEDQDIARTLSRQISGPVRWVESIRYLLRHAAARDCREAGTGNVLTRMLRQIESAPDAEPTAAATATAIPRGEPDTRPVPTVEPTPRLFCIAYAGGDERAYAGLTEHCAGLDVRTLERPGRGRRVSEPLLDEPERIVEDLLAQIHDRLDAPYAIYGHSLGARLGFLLCRRLRAEQLPAPLHLFVSGESGPAIPSREADTWKLPTDAFWDRMKLLGGVPPELLRYADMMAFYERILRADFTALGSYTHVTEAPLDLPITAMNGDGEWFTEADIEAWQRESTRPLTTYRFPGDHFFIRDHGSALAKIFHSGFQIE